MERYFMKKAAVFTAMILNPSINLSSQLHYCFLISFYQRVQHEVKHYAIFIDLPCL